MSIQATFNRLPINMLMRKLFLVKTLTWKHREYCFINTLQCGILFVQSYLLAYVGKVYSGA
jgi:hypothetical protein